MYNLLRFILAIDRLIVTADRHQAGAARVIRLAELALAGGALVVLHDLVRPLG